MSLKVLTAIALVLPPVMAFPASAENLVQVQQLLDTGACAGCDLRGAEVSGSGINIGGN